MELSVLSTIFHFRIQDRKIFSGGIILKRQGGYTGKSIEVEKSDTVSVTWMKVPKTNQLGVQIKDGLFYKFTGFRDQEICWLL